MSAHGVKLMTKNTSEDVDTGEYKYEDSEIGRLRRDKYIIVYTEIGREGEEMSEETHTSVR